jgi:hypothetical protein
MAQHPLKHHQIFLTLLVTLYIGTLLAFEHMNGGVISHHILNNPDLPAISNWWGALLLPVLSWFLLGRIYRRVQGSYPFTVLMSFIGALLFGVLVSVLFRQGQHQVLSQLMFSLPLLALFFPLYRAEFLLGFVLAMAYTFGALLPTGFGLLVTLMALLVYKGVRFFFSYGAALLNRSAQS